MNSQDYCDSHRQFHFGNVSILAITLFLLSAGLFGCSTMQKVIEPVCKTHAYLSTPLEDVVFSNESNGETIRMAIVPFTVPANLTATNSSTTGLGNELAWWIHQGLLESEVVPIVEILNREDWPGKRDEFFAGNFGAISQGYEAGYDLILVGFLEELTTPYRGNLLLKVIDVKKGVTVSYVQASSWVPKQSDYWLIPGYLTPKRNPNESLSRTLFEQLADCGVTAVLNEPQLPAEPSMIDSILAVSIP